MGICLEIKIIPIAAIIPLITELGNNWQKTPSFKRLILFEKVQQ